MHPNILQLYDNIDCQIPSNDNVMNYNSTFHLDSSTQVLQFRCKIGFLPTHTLKATCLPNGSWIPNKNDHTCRVIYTGKLLTGYACNTHCIVPITTKLKNMRMMDRELYTPLMHALIVDL
jgi:hypothetical protein